MTKTWAAIVLVAVAAVATAGMAHAQTSSIPDWVKDVAGFWSDGMIDDAAFTNSIQYMLDEKIIILPSTQELTNTIETLHGDIDRLETENQRLDDLNDHLNTRNEALNKKIDTLEYVEDCIVDCGIIFEVISCEESGNDALVKGIIKNTGEETLKVQYFFTLLDKDGNGVAIDSEIIDALYPGQTKNLSEFIDSPYDWESCLMNAVWIPVT